MQSFIVLWLQNLESDLQSGRLWLQYAGLHPLAWSLSKLGPSLTAASQWSQSVKMHKRIDFRDSRKTDNVCLFPRSFQDQFNLVLCFSHFTSNQWLLSTDPGFSVWMSEAWHRVFMVLARPLLHFPLCEDLRVSAQSEVKKVNTGSVGRGQSLLLLQVTSLLARACSRGE